MAAAPISLTHAVTLYSSAATYDNPIRVAWRQGLKLGRVTSRLWARLHSTSLQGGTGFVVLTKMSENKALIQDGRTMRSEMVTGAALEASWNNSLILIIKQASLSELCRHFGFSWFIMRARMRLISICVVSVGNAGC